MISLIYKCFQRLLVFCWNFSPSTYAPTVKNISVKILEKVVDNAVAYRRDRLGKKNEVINQAIITIPAYFNDKQNNAMRSLLLEDADYDGRSRSMLQKIAGALNDNG